MFGKLGGLGVVAVVLMLGCSDDGDSAGSPGGSGGSSVEAGADVGPDVSQVCEPGKQEACACPGGSAGAQRCADDGASWETCICSDAAAGPDAGDAGDAPVDSPTDIQSDVLGDVAAEADAQDLCPIDNAEYITCPGTDCASCIETACDSECHEKLTHAIPLMPCYCVCEETDADCFTTCDTKYLYAGGSGADYFAELLSCIRTNCPPECDFRPE